MVSREIGRKRRVGDRDRQDKQRRAARRDDGVALPDRRGARTVRLRTSLRAKYLGWYMSSTYAPGALNVPGTVARAM